MTDNKIQHISKEKNYALSNFCGFLILLAICCFYFESLGITLVNQIPTADGQVALAGKLIDLSDVVMSMFILFIVFSFANHAERYALNNGTKGLVKSYVFRYVILITIGLAVALIDNIIYGSRRFDFNIFCSLGISGLLSLFFIKLKDKHKLIVGICIIVAYQFLLLVPSLLFYISSFSYGGFLGMIALVGYILVLMFLSKVYKKDLLQFILCIIVFAGVFFLFFIVDIITAALSLETDFFAASKSRLSIYYLLICLLISSAIFLFFAQLTKNKKIPILNWYGTNGLIMFVFADVIVRALGTLTKIIVPVQGNYWFYQVFPIGIIIVSAISIALAYFLYKFKITDKITKNNFCLTL